jgi:hypothetical protein
VESDDESIYLDIPDHLDEDVFNLENGNLGGPPAPAIRTFKNRINEKLYLALEEAIVKTIFDMDIFQ